jgi:tetratricopeptide (TPR) repeat protein
LILGRYEEATTLLEDLVARAPAMPKFHFALGSAYLTERKLDKADRELAIALKLYPESLAAGRVKSTIAELRKTKAEVAPDLTTVPGQLKQVDLLARQGRHKDALELLESAIQAAEMNVPQLTEAMLYAFDWGSPRQITAIYKRYRALGGAAPAIIDNYELRMERVRRLRALWLTLGGSRKASTPALASSLTAREAHGRAQPD